MAWPLTNKTPARTDAMPEARETPQTRPPAATNDPVMDEAKRVLERERQNLNLPPPAEGVTSADGRVHLRSGGSISREEWEAARRKLNDSPTLREPPALPPF